METSNKKVATVKSSGKAKATVKALRAGTATITGKAGGKKATCKVKVAGKLSDASLDIDCFTSDQLYLYGATAKSWTSSNEAAVEVSRNGRVSHGFKGFVDNYLHRYGWKQV